MKCFRSLKFDARTFGHQYFGRRSTWGSTLLYLFLGSEIVLAPRQLHVDQTYQCRISNVCNLIFADIDYIGVCR
jgi:hypothetical protein